MPDFWALGQNMAKMTFFLSPANSFWNFWEKIELTFILARKPTSTTLIGEIQGFDSIDTPKKQPLGVKNH